LSIDVAAAVLLEIDAAAPALLRAADALCVPFKVDDECFDVDVTVAVLSLSLTMTFRDCRDDASDEVLELS